MTQEVSVYRVLAPKSWPTKKILIYLRLDPAQTRVSKHLIPLTHPRSGKTLPLKEFVEDMIGDSRFAIETQDSIIFVSRVENSLMGASFVPMKVLPKDSIEKKNKSRISD